MTDEPAAASEAPSPDASAPGAAPAPRRRRSPLIDLAVILFGGYLLVTMFGDVRYMLQGGTPRDLGDAATLVEKGLPGDLGEQYVTLRGTPDVQRTARHKIGHKTDDKADDKTVQYLRIIEGGGSLFAARPVAEGSDPSQFEGTFTGRMRRLNHVRMLPWIVEYFNGERIAENQDLTTEQLLAGLDSGRFHEGEQISLTIDQPDARVQLGRSSFADQAAATAAVAALGFPFIVPADQSSANFYTAFARIPADQRAAAQQKLVAAGTPAPGDKPDPRFGAVVVPFSTTYLVPAHAITRAGDKLSIVHGDSTTNPGYILADGALAPRPLKDGRLEVAPAELRAVGVVRSIRVDPDGYIILVGDHPYDQWPSLALWLVVLGVVGWNAASLALLWRRRQA